MSRNQRIALALLVPLMAAAAWLVRGSLDPHAVRRGAPVERPVEPRPVTQRDGLVRDLAKPPGKVLVLHFWATWCKPCEAELPSLLAWWREHGAKDGSELLTVSVDDDFATVDAFLKARGATDLPVALDPQRKTALAFGTEKFPETWILASDGKVLSRYRGTVDWTSAEFRKVLDQLLATSSTGAAAPKAASAG